MKGLVVRMALALGIVSSAAVASSDAGACGGEEVMPAIDYRVMGVAQAEQALRDGHLVAAAGSVVRMMPEIRTTGFGHDPLIHRAMRIIALATARFDGALPLKGQVPFELLGSWRGKSTDERSANLEWSIATLRRLNEHRANDPALQTDLGEALARADGHQQEALNLLGGLADKDLVSSPEGYAALAKLREQAGDRTGRDAAAKRCAAMAQDASICQVASAPGAQS